MCGRFVMFSTGRVCAELFNLPLMPDLQARYNIAPTQAVYAVREAISGKREMLALRWGLVPSWSKGPDSRFSMINARAETVHTKPAYRAAFRYRRCLIPADGFFEWQASAAGKQPYFIRMKTQKLFAMAGIWEHWQGPDGSELETCSIIVTEANADIRLVHERMPVIIDPQNFVPWLDPRNQVADSLRELLRPLPEGTLELFPVSRQVNSPANDAEELVRPLTAG